MNSKPLSTQNLKRLKYISSFLKIIRLNEGLTQLEVSEQSNLHRNTIHRLESANNITLMSLFDICDYYEITLSDLLQDVE